MGLYLEQRLVPEMTQVNKYRVSVKIVTGRGCFWPELGQNYPLTVTIFSDTLYNKNLDFERSFVG